MRQGRGPCLASGSSRTIAPAVRVGYAGRVNSANEGREFGASYR
jgi:hypothetical protein